MSIQAQAEHSAVHARDFLAGSAFSAVSMAVGGVLTMLTGIVFARRLGPEGFGVYSLVLVGVSFLGGCGTAGMDAMVARFTAYYLGSGNPQKIRAVIAYSLSSALLFSVVLATLTGLGLHLKRVSLSLPASLGLLLGATTPLLALQLVLQQALSGLQWVRTRVVLEKIVQPVLRLGIPFLLLPWLSTVLHAVIAALTLTALVVSAAALFVVFKATRNLAAADSGPRERREWFKYALPCTFNAMQNFIYAGMGVDVFLVSALATVRDSGIYAAAFRFAPVLLLARVAMDYAFGPKVGVLYGKSDFRSIATLYRISSSAGLIWTVPLAVVLAVFGRPLMGGFLGPAYAEGATALAVIAIGFVIDGATGCNGTLLALMGRPWLVLLNGLVSGGASIGLCFALIPGYGIAGAAIAVTVARTAANAMTTIQIWHLQRLQPFDGSTVRVVLAGAAAGVFGLACHSQLKVTGSPVLVLGLAIVGVLATYVGSLWLTRVQWRLNPSVTGEPS